MPIRWRANLRTPSKTRAAGVNPVLAQALSRLDQLARPALPFLITLIAALLSAVPWPWPQFGPVAPPFALMAVYYWSIHRPDMFGGISAFTIGLLLDALLGTAFGLHALSFVVIHQLCLQQRHLFVNHSFFILWFGFAVSALAVALLQWIGLSAYEARWMPLGAPLVQAVLAGLLFPLPAALLIALQRHALSADDWRHMPPGG